MRKILFLAALLATFSFTTSAQTTGSLSGTVTDPNGAIVAGAAVTVTNTATGTARNATTSSAGLFSLEAMQPGNYTVSVEATGFKKTIAPDIMVEVSKMAQINVVMSIGLASETVTVTAAQEVINTSSPTLTNVINTRQVVDLPLPTRNPLELAGLQAGIAVIGNDVRGSSVGGLRQTATNVTQDGINAMDNFVKTSSFFAISSPSLNSTAEFSITTGTVGSEAGRGVGQVNIVTKSGSNDFHGGLFYMNRNDALQANNFFNNLSGTRRPRQNQHFFGFDIGGPVYFLGFGEGVPALWSGKDRAFFFFSYEGFRENFSATRTRTVLTPEARQGIFRYPGTNGALQTVNLLSIGNVATLNPVMSALIAGTPLPNATVVGVGDGFNTSAFRYNVSGTDNQDKYVARYDHQLVRDSKYGGHKFEFVFNRAHFLLSPDTFNGLESLFPGGINAFQESKRYLVTGALISTFGSNVTNTFRYGRQWAPVAFLRDSQPTSPFVLFAAGTTPDNTFMSQGRTTYVDQYIDNVSWVKGKHLMRFGVDYQKIFADTFNDAGINPTITLGTNTSNPNGLLQSELPFSVSADLTRAAAVYNTIVGYLGNAAATFNVTSPTSGFVQGATRSRVFRQQDLALFAQDQWRFRQNLTISAGLRWEFQGVPTVPNGLSILPNVDDLFGISGFGNVFTPNAPAGAAPGIATQQFVSGDTGIPLYNDDWNNFAPFVGIAWSPSFEGGIGKFLFGAEGKSSVRLGYSVSYLHDGFTVISNALGTGTTNPGLIQTSANTTPVGVLTAAGVPLTTPTFSIPITDRQNNLINPGNGLWAIDPDLKIPYVQQWNIGFEREIFSNTAFEVRYSGNRAAKVWRGVDFNEINIFENGFLTEFLNAQRNLTARGGSSFAPDGTAGLPACATCVPLPILARFFTGATLANSWSSSGFIGNLNGNNVGTMAASLAFSNTYRSARENPLNGIPANFFVANPNASFARLLTNDSMSNYHALEVIVRRRFADGLLFDGAYTYSKALSDAPDGQGNNQSTLENFRTLRDKSLDYRRANFDQTHRFVANALYELPFGKGKTWFGGANSFVDALIGGWSAGGIVTWSTRPPWFVLSGRTTFNAWNAGTEANNLPAQLTGISFEEFRRNVGIYRTPTGIYFVNPDLLDITTNASGQFVSSRLRAGLMGAPAPGTFGNFPMNSLDGPSYFNIDASLVKRIPIGERVKLELKTTVINILNRANFAFGNVNFDSTSFGRITGTSGSPRVIHFTGSVRF